jgi:CMP-N-acetylneuraminic acid synthetase
VKADAIVPIKKNSVRIPNKNFKLLNGKPLYKYILETLQNCRLVDKIFVDTDVKKNIDFEGVTIINRPQQLRGDHVSVNRLIEHDLQFSESEYFIQTHVTNPFVTASTIDKAIKYSMIKKKPVFGVTEIYGRLWTNDSIPLNHNPEVLERTQDLKPVLLDNSCFYVFSKSFFDRYKMRMNASSIAYPLGTAEYLDLDDDVDWRIAECMIKQL